MSAPDRATELLADRAVQPLDEAEHRELDALLAEHPELDDGSFELAAAAFDLALGPSRFEPLPDALRARLEASAMEHVAPTAPSGQAPTGQAPTRRAPDAPPPAAERGPAVLPGPGSDAARARPSSTLPWFVAAAATLLALLGWLRGADGPEAVEVAMARALFERSEPADLVRLDWKAAGDPLGEGVGGDVLWSDAAQEGYLSFTGLAANDPSVEQYQLWIFDKSQPLETPVDGGVFDVAAGDGQAIVAIDPKIDVGEGFAFAVTVEKPGGVVVSSRERLALVAGL